MFLVPDYTDGEIEKDFFSNEEIVEAPTGYPTLAPSINESESNGPFYRWLGLLILIGGGTLFTWFVTYKQRGYVFYDDKESTKPLIEDIPSYGV